MGPFIYANGVHSAAQQAVFHSLGCMRTWGQTEEPHTEQFAMDKEKFAIQIFPIFNDCKLIFLVWGLGSHINVYCGCQKYSLFHFFLQIPVIFRSQFLNFKPCLEPMILLKIFKRQFLYFFNSENPSSCQQQWWNIQEMLFLFKSTPENKKSKHSKHLLHHQEPLGSQRAYRTYCTTTTTNTTTYYLHSR